MERVQRKDYDLDELLAGITPKNQPELADDGHALRVSLSFRQGAEN